MRAPGSDAADRLLAGRRRFTELVAEAEAWLDARRPATAAVYAGAAALSAVFMHPGCWFSPALEQVLRRASVAALGTPPQRSRAAGSLPSHVLHVLTFASDVGGHSRLVWRWVAADAERKHSVVVTQQRGSPLPSELRGAVQSAGGRFLVLDELRGGVVERAAALRAAASEADVVVLHVRSDDVVPSLAFAGWTSRPTVIFVDHADQQFWLGRGTLDILCSLRDSGRRLALERRAVEPERSVLLPIILPEPARRLSRADARRFLDLPEDPVILLSVGRPEKFQGIDGRSVASLLLPVLRRHERAFLVLVGPALPGELEEARHETGGRVAAFGVRPDTNVFMQAADVYLDSFPVMSPTALLEAGSYGLPLIAHAPYAPRDLSIVTADAPGLTGAVVTTRDDEQFRSQVAELIEHEDLRRQLGERARRSILALHTGPGWRNALEELYRRAAESSPAPPTLPATADVADAEDAVVAHVFGFQARRFDLMRYHMRLLPALPRLREWLRLAATEHVVRPDLLLPEWTAGRLRSLRWRARAALRGRRVRDPLPFLRRAWGGGARDLPGR